MRHATLAVALSLICAAPVAAADDFTAEKAKALIPDAAGMPSDALQKLASGENLTPEKFREPVGESLTCWVFTYEPRDAPKNPTSFRFLSEQPNPAAIARAVSGPQDKSGNFRKVATVIQPEYITDCTCKVSGDTATGTVSFKAEKAYEGKVEYTARKKNGAWRVEEFRLPEFKVTLVLGADGKWAKK